MNTTVTISISKDITKDFKEYKLPFSKLVDLMKSDFNYSAGTFNDGYRKKDNFKGYQDLIILDIDDGLTIKEAKKVFEPLTHIIATTKSHQKEKNGLVCDRFRVLLPIDEPIDVDNEEYLKIMQDVMREFSFVDKACKDSSRFYYPSKNSEVFYHQGFTNLCLDVLRQNAARDRFTHTFDLDEKVRRVRDDIFEKPLDEKEIAKKSLENWGAAKTGK